MKKLRIGVILSDVNVPVWVARMLEQIRDSSHAKIIVLSFIGDNSTTREVFANRLSELHLELDKAVFRPDPNPWEQLDIRKVLPNVPLLQSHPSKWSFVLKFADLDIFINLSQERLPDTLLNAARYGIWSLRSNDRRITTSTAIGWLELQDDKSLIHCAVEAQRGATVQVIAKSVMAANRYSFTHNQKSFLWRAASLIPYAIKQLHLHGEEKFFAYAEFVGLATKISKPGASQIVDLALKQFVGKFKNKVWKRGAEDRWILMAGIRSSEDTLSWDKLKPIVPPAGAFWADPFIVHKDTKTYIFFEEFIHRTKLGRISYVEIEQDGTISQSRAVLEKPYHLSYPFIFEYRSEFYMIPETAQHHAIDMYRCTRFPDQWEHHKTIMRDLRAVDATLIEHTGLWWMFVNIAGKGSSTWDELHLFYANDPLSDEWTPHPMNPIVSDVRSARPAGRIFSRDGELIRPSQDSSLRYGYALNMNRITKLTTNEYEEELLERLEPPEKGDILAVHTHNFSGNLTVVDAMLK